MQNPDLAHHDGGYKRIMRSLAKAELLILNDYIVTALGYTACIAGLLELHGILLSSKVA